MFIAVIFGGVAFITCVKYFFNLSPSFFTGLGFLIFIYASVNAILYPTPPEGERSAMKYSLFVQEIVNGNAYDETKGGTNILKIKVSNSTEFRFKYPSIRCIFDTDNPSRFVSTNVIGHEIDPGVNEINFRIYDDKWLTRSSKAVHCVFGNNDQDTEERANNYCVDNLHKKCAITPY